jgi:hypothetical protein
MDTYRQKIFISLLSINSENFVLWNEYLTVIKISVFHFKLAAVVLFQVSFTEH